MSVQNLGSEVCCLLQVAHGFLKLPQAQLPMSSFKIEFSARWSEGQTLGSVSHGLSVLPASCLRFGELQHPLHTLRISREALAGVDYARVIGEGVEIAPKSGGDFESAMPGIGTHMRKQLRGQAKNCDKEKNSNVDFHASPSHAAFG